MPYKLSRIIRAQETYDLLEEQDLLDDRREYTEEDLKLSLPELHADEVNCLYNMIQGTFIDVSNLDPKAVMAYFGEAEHGSWDGWESLERGVINMLKADIATAIKNGLV